MLPIVSQGQAIGFVEVEDSRFERTFTDHQIALAQTLASQATIAIQNARLYEQAKQEITERKQAE